MVTISVGTHDVYKINTVLSISKAERAMAEEQLQQKDDQIHQKNIQIQRQVVELQQKDAQIHQKDTELNSIRESLQVFIVLCVHEICSSKYATHITLAAC